MGEALSSVPSAEERVFGGSLSLLTFQVDRQRAIGMYKERVELFRTGQQVWIPRRFDADDRSVVADLFKDRIGVASLEFDFKSSQADVYSFLGDIAGSLLVEHVSFEEAVAAAEALLSQP